MSTEVSPYLVGIFEPVSDERRDTSLRVTGEIPAALNGTYMRNGGNPAFPPQSRYHVFDGDGMIHAVTFEDGVASYANRWVESKGLRAERREGHALFGGLSEWKMPPAHLVEEVGIYKNTANTNIVRHAGRYLALMEAALPTELDAELNTLGEYNFGGALSSPMTAHPKIDPITGEMHFFGYLPFAPYLRYHVISPNGEMTTSMDIELERAVMMHDFVITRDHVVFFDLPALFDIETMMSGGTGIRWDAAQGARIGVLPRGASADAISWTEIEPCYVFHFLNGWDEDGKVVVDACRSEAMPISFGDDAPPDPSIQPTLHRYVIDPATATATVTQIDDRPGDFPRVNDEYAGLKNRYGYLGELDSRNRETLLINAVTQWDFTTDTSTTYNYGDTKACGEAVFAPDPAGTAENDGWLLNFVTDTDALTSELVILDARDLAAGPVAQVHIPRRVPFGFHGNWMPA